ncbi:hypothetical protein ARMSODRAFT_979126 [Armillaria solidipes]|uniref:Uncharacterized protein n=1 Tax=Armillaria solidipes TaxID=1076256 RepID=A0A2H3BMK2_9AGAR|nr:hypothetical protein ARMSODRAFT_979126 [Armillaria solidipes]
MSLNNCGGENQLLHENVMFKVSNGDAISDLSESKLEGVAKKRLRNQRLWEWSIIDNDLSRIRGCRKDVTRSDARETGQSSLRSAAKSAAESVCNRVGSILRLIGRVMANKDAHFPLTTITFFVTLSPFPGSSEMWPLNQVVVFCHKLIMSVRAFNYAAILNRRLIKENLSSGNSKWTWSSPSDFCSSCKALIYWLRLVFEAKVDLFCAWAPVTAREFYLSTYPRNAMRPRWVNKEEHLVRSEDETGVVIRGGVTFWLFDSVHFAPRSIDATLSGTMVAPAGRHLLGPSLPTEGFFAGIVDYRISSDVG